MRCFRSHLKAPNYLLFLSLFILLMAPTFAFAHSTERTKVLFGQNIEIAKDEEMKNIVIFGGTLKVKGRISNDVIIFSGNLEMYPDSIIEGDALIIGGSLQRQDNSYIEGEIIKVDIGRSINKLVRSINYETHKMEKKITKKENSMLFFTYPLMFFISCFGIGILMLVFLPKHTRVAWKMAQEKTVLSWIFGACSIIALPLIAILMTISIIGIPLIPILILATTFAILWGYIIVALLIGGRIIKKKNTSFIKPLAIGLFTISLIMYIPYLGPAVLFLLMFLGLGATVASAFGTKPPSMSWKIISKGHNETHH